MTEKIYNHIEERKITVPQIGHLLNLSIQTVLEKISKKSFTKSQSKKIRAYINLPNLESRINNLESYLNHLEMYLNSILYNAYCNFGNYLYKNRKTPIITIAQINNITDERVLKDLSVYKTYLNTQIKLESLKARKINLYNSNFVKIEKTHFIKAHLFYKNTPIDWILDEVSFLKVLIQIKDFYNMALNKSGNSDYTIHFGDQIIPITKLGEITQTPPGFFFSEIDYLKKLLNS